jgi:Putative zinc-finger
MSDNHAVAHDLGPYALGVLDPDDALVVEAHLRDCASCRAELAELRLVQSRLGDMPPEFFLDGPPEDGDLLLQRTIEQVREESRGGGQRRRLLLLGVAAAVVVGALFGGGLLIGRETADIVVAPPEDIPTPSSSATAGTPVPGTKTVGDADPVTGAALGVTVTPAAGWVKVDAKVTGIGAGERCRVIVVGINGQEEIAGSWLVSEKAETQGTVLSGFAIVPPEEVTAVRVENFDGDEFVSVTIS